MAVWLATSFVSDVNTQIGIFVATDLIGWFVSSTRIKAFSQDVGFFKRLLIELPFLFCSVIVPLFFLFLVRTMRFRTF